MSPNRHTFLNIVATRSSSGHSFRCAHSLADSMTCVMGRSLYAMAIGLFTARWVLMSLGEVDYGLMGVVGGLTAFVTFLNGIMAGGIGRFYAISIGCGDCEKRCPQWQFVIPDEMAKIDKYMTDAMRREYDLKLN